MALPCLSSMRRSHLAAVSSRSNLTSTVCPSGSVSWPRMSSSQSSASCGEMKTLSISTPVLLMRVKSCAPLCAAAELEFAALALAAGLAAREAAVLAAALELRLPALAFEVALELEGAVDEQAAVRYSAQAVTQIRLSLFIENPSVCSRRTLRPRGRRPGLRVFW